MEKIKMKSNLQKLMGFGFEVFNEYNDGMTGYYDQINDIDKIVESNDTDSCGFRIDESKNFIIIEKFEDSLNPYFEVLFDDSIKIFQNGRILFILKKAERFDMKIFPHHFENIGTVISGSGIFCFPKTELAEAYIEDNSIKMPYEFDYEDFIYLKCIDVAGNKAV
jgi:hypothetical protein